jgi:hypothetical protein
MTTPELDDLQTTGGAFGISLFSKTQEGGVYKSPKMTINGISTTLKLRDTVGFGAMDMKTNDILKKTFLDLVSDFDKTRGCILVHKCERYREGGHKDLVDMKNMFKTMGLDFNKHLLLVITHTGHLSEETKTGYTQEIRTKVLPEVPADKIIHINFANVEELNEEHRDFYESTTETEFLKMINKLKEFQDEIAPGARDIREHFDKAYDENLQTRVPVPNPLSSIVTGVLNTLPGNTCPVCIFYSRRRAYCCRSDFEECVQSNNSRIS